MNIIEKLREKITPVSKGDVPYILGVTNNGSPIIAHLGNPGGNKTFVREKYGRRELVHYPTLIVTDTHTSRLLLYQIANSMLSKNPGSVEIINIDYPQTERLAITSNNVSLYDATTIGDKLSHLTAEIQRRNNGRGSNKHLVLMLADLAYFAQVSSYEHIAYLSNIIRLGSRVGIHTFAAVEPDRFDDALSKMRSTTGFFNDGIFGQEIFQHNGQLIAHKTGSSNIVFNIK